MSAEDAAANTRLQRTYTALLLAGKATQAEPLYWLLGRGVDGERAWASTGDATAHGPASAPVGAGFPHSAGPGGDVPPHAAAGVGHRELRELQDAAAGGR